MPRKTEMNFALTPGPIRAKTKTVTRRLDWSHLKPGDVLDAVLPVAGSEETQVVRRIAVTSTRTERLSEITPEEVKREGLSCSPEEFVAMMAGHYQIARDALINRIEFEYLECAEAGRV